MFRNMTIALCILSTTVTIQAKSLNFQKVNMITKEVLRENDHGLLSEEIKDIKDFCPKYNYLNLEEREDFFANLITVMSSYESSFNPNTTLKENNGNISAGLLQISYGSLNPLYRKNGCNVIENANDLRDPRKNIQCGLGIIATLVKKDNHLATGKSLGASRYWSVLRQPYSVYIKSLNKTVKVGKRDKVIKDLKLLSDRCF